MGYIQGEDRQQITLFPESIDDYVSNDNPVRVVDAFVMSLDIKALGFQRAEHASTGKTAEKQGRFLKGPIGSFAREKGSTSLCQQLVEP